MNDRELLALASQAALAYELASLLKEWLENEDDDKDWIDYEDRVTAALKAMEEENAI